MPSEFHAMGEAVKRTLKLQNHNPDYSYHQARPGLSHPGAASSEAKPFPPNLPKPVHQRRDQGSSESWQNQGARKAPPVAKAVTKAVPVPANFLPQHWPQQGLGGCSDLGKGPQRPNRWGKAPRNDELL